MLTLKPNEDKSEIQMIFSDFFTHESQFITAFNLNEAEKIGNDLLQMVKEIKK